MILKSEVKTEARPVLVPVKPEMVEQRPVIETTSVVNSMCITKSEGKRPHARDVNKNTKRVKRQPTETSDIILTTYSIIWRYLSDLQKKQFGK